MPNPDGTLRKLRLTAQRHSGGSGRLAMERRLLFHRRMRAALFALAAALGCGGDVVGADGSPAAATDAAAAAADDADGEVSIDAGHPWVDEPLMIGIASGHPTFMDHADIE